MQRGVYPDFIDGKIDQRIPHTSKEYGAFFEEEQLLAIDFADLIDIIKRKVCFYTTLGLLRLIDKFVRCICIIQTLR